MMDMTCSYGDHRDEAIVAFLYADSEASDGSPVERAPFEAHLQTCARCRAEVKALRGVRTQLGRWSPPEPSFAVVSHQSSVSSPQSSVFSPQSAVRNPHWWERVPVWAQVAAAMLCLGVSAGIANLDVRYDHSGLTVRTGRSGGAGGSGGSESAQPWKADIAALESQLKNAMRAAQTSTVSAPSPARAVAASSAPVSEAEVTRRVRALVEESEKRQQRELALRIAELLRDVAAQRQADLVKIDRTLGVVQNTVGIEVMKNRQQINQMDLLYRASQRQ